MRLAVELSGTVVGTLTGDVRSFDFIPSAAGIERFGTNSTALSVTLPLTPTQRKDLAGRRRNWFSELLPEGDQYDFMLAQGGLRRGDTLGFLARYGRDVAGALQLWDVDDPTEPRIPALRSLAEKDIRALLEDPVRSPLANDREAGKSSLGGVQPKVVLVRTGESWSQSLGGYPTTHILKPQLSGRHHSVIFDEEYGARISRRMGLADFDASVEDFDGLKALVIERFDRDSNGRVHQEDFSQALGASGNQKYQSMGGVVSLHRIAQTLQKFAPRPELIRFARYVVLAVGIGNLDMHTKNIGLIHSGSGDVSLAPAYDVVPQAHLSNDGELALAVNRTYRHASVTREDLIAEFSSWRLRQVERIIDDALDELIESATSEVPLPGAFSDLQAQILGFARHLREGRRVGAAERRRES